jgi:hypothetical protein
MDGWGQIRTVRCLLCPSRVTSKLKDLEAIKAGPGIRDVPSKLVKTWRRMGRDPAAAGLKRCVVIGYSQPYPRLDAAISSSVTHLWSSAQRTLLVAKRMPTIKLTSRMRLLSCVVPVIFALATASMIVMAVIQLCYCAPHGRLPIEALSVAQ